MPAYTVADLNPRIAMANYHEVRDIRKWGRRTIPNVELILAIDGYFEYLDDREGLLPHEPRQVLLIPPERPHVYRVAADCPVAFFSCIHCEPVAGLRYAEGHYELSPSPQRLTDVSYDRDLPELFRRAAAEFEGYGRFRNEIVSTIVREIWLRLARRWMQPESLEGSVRLREMLSFLSEHLTNHPTRLDLAETFNLTPQHVNYLFRRELGISPTGFVHRECALRAYRMLQEEGLSVQEVADRLGFSDAFYFSKVFKRVLGIPPSWV